MAKFSLIPFSDESAPKISIQSELNTTEKSIFISFKVQGDLSAIDLGSGHPQHERKIKLWEKTCFEFFIKNSIGNYLEFNFSPDFEWNSFYFPTRGAPLLEFQKMDSIKMEILNALEVFHVFVEIRKEKFPSGFFEGEIRAGITSVIKDKNSKASYWALSHHDTRPNFHDFRSFDAIV